MLQSSKRVIRHFLMHWIPNVTAERAEHEQAFARFIMKSKRQRYFDLLQSERGRAKVIRALPHFSDWEPSAIVELASQSRTPRDIAAALISKGAPALAYVLSAVKDLDGQVLPLLTSLEQIVGFAPGTVLSCIPGTLGYYEGESRHDRHILEIQRRVGGPSLR